MILLLNKEGFLASGLNITNMNLITSKQACIQSYTRKSTKTNYARIKGVTHMLHKIFLTMTGLIKETKVPMQSYLTLNPP